MRIVILDLPARLARSPTLHALALSVTILIGAQPVHAQRPVRLAIFGFDWQDTSQEGELRGTVRDDEARRLREIAETMRAMMGAKRYEIVDLTPARDRIEKAHPLTKCNGCDADIARDLGADLAIIGHGQKVSNLILNINVSVRDVESGAVLRTASVDIRGNTDESWARGVSYMVRNRLLDPPLPAPPQ